MFIYLFTLLLSLTCEKEMRVFVLWFHAVGKRRGVALYFLPPTNSSDPIAVNASAPLNPSNQSLSVATRICRLWPSGKRQGRLTASELATAERDVTADRGSRRSRGPVKGFSVKVSDWGKRSSPCFLSWQAHSALILLLERRLKPLGFCLSPASIDF